MSKTSYRIKFSIQELTAEDDGTVSEGRLTEIDDEIEFQDIGRFITDAMAGIVFVHTGQMPMHMLKLVKEKTNERKIESIKLLRASTSIGLVQAKNIIEGKLGTVMMYCDEYDDVVTYQKIFNSLGYECAATTVPVDKHEFSITPKACPTYNLFNNYPEYKRYV